jgi:hypothetical protein
MPTISINICNNFSAKPGEPVRWQNIPVSGCTVSQDGSNGWPFNIGPPIVFPMPSAREITIAKGLKPGKYYFLATCCPQAVCVTVT